MKKEKSLRHSLIFSAMLPVLSILPNITYGALPVRYSAQNVYYPDTEKYACQVSVETEFQQDYKIAKGTIINVEVMRYNKALERPTSRKKSISVCSMIRQEYYHLSVMQ